MTFTNLALNNTFSFPWETCRKYTKYFIEIFWPMFQLICQKDSLLKTNEKKIVIMYRSLFTNNINI